MKTVICPLTLALVLSGCASAVSTAVQGPNGVPAYVIKCRSASIEACYAEAAKVCPKGYGFANQPVISNGLAPNSMLVECKP